ncbi:MAG: pilus assembly protein TadG-related protein [Pseudomonadota bacterium]
MRHTIEDSLRQFRRRDEGGILLFILVLFLLMALAIGMAVDFMRHEMARADLQNALDRCTIAAAALSQRAAIEVDADGDGTFDVLTDEEIEQNYQSLCADYMKSRSVFPAPLQLDVDWEEANNTKTILAEASYSLPTSFLMLAGKSKLSVEAKSFARQGFNDVEVSLVFDISGSMENNDVTVEGETRTRLAQAKIDAKNFVTDMFARDVLGDQISMSLIPYSSKVSLPPKMALAYNLQPAPGATELYGVTIDVDGNITTDVDGNEIFTDQFCFDFDVADFTTRSITITQPFTQFPLFNYNDTTASCPRAGNEIVPLSRNPDGLRLTIDNLTKEGWTSVYEGVKWGTAMLDPVTRDAQPSFQVNGVVGPAEANLPRDYGSSVIKALVVMSDGRNTQIPTMLQAEYLQQSDGSPVVGQPHDYWRGETPNRHYNEEGWTCAGRATADGAISKFSDNCSVAAGASDLDFGVGISDLSANTLVAYEDGTAVTEPDALLYEICDQAKAAGIIIYTIAFEIEPGSRGARALRECASTVDGLKKAFEVGGENLDEAFDAIVADVSNLKLTAAPEVEVELDGGGSSSDPGGDDETVVEVIGVE